MSLKKRTKSFEDIETEVNLFREKLQQRGESLDREEVEVRAYRQKLLYLKNLSEGEDYNDLTWFADRTSPAEREK